MPEKNEHLVKDWQEEVKELEAELEKANALLKSKMDQVNKETNVSSLFIFSLFFGCFKINSKKFRNYKTKKNQSKLN